MTDMVRVRMKMQMSGGRYDGRVWPGWGQEFDVPDWEAHDLVLGGIADLVSPPAEARAVEAPAETPKPVETRDETAPPPTVAPPVRATRATSGQPRTTRGT